MPRSAALSPSRVNDFRTCPLKFRFAVVDRIPQPPAPAREKGTLVHAVLEDMFDLPSQKRHVEEAQEMVEPHWRAMIDKNPQLATELFSGPHPHHEQEEFLSQARELIGQYFQLEIPSRLSPAHRERYVRTTIGDGLRIHGFIDRVDIAPSGAVRLVDYKTGKAPNERFLSPYIFQLRFYALVWEKLTGNAPARLQLLFLKNARTFTLDPVPGESERTIDDLMSVWGNIAQAAHNEDFEPRRNGLCNWCDFQSLCPLFGGTPPTLPEEGITRLLSMHE